jgi:hypothetical protein
MHEVYDIQLDNGKAFFFVPTQLSRKDKDLLQSLLNIVFSAEACQILHDKEGD